MLCTSFFIVMESEGLSHLKIPPLDSALRLYSAVHVPQPVFLKDI